MPAGYYIMMWSFLPVLIFFFERLLIFVKFDATLILSLNFYVMKQNEQMMQPFFAQFLEAQKNKQQRSNETTEQAWPFPSNPIIDYDQTMKYPSDGDDDYPKI